MTATEYDTCVATHSDNLYRFALKSLQDSELAKDIVQESFMRLWENRKSVLSGKEKSYLFTIAYRLIIDDVRYGQRYGSNEILDKATTDDPDRGYNNLSDIIEQHLNRLPPQQKTLILMRDYEGYSYKEIAEVTSLSEAQVKVYIFRARTTLKHNIGDLKHIL